MKLIFLIPLIHSELIDDHELVDNFVDENNSLFPIEEDRPDGNWEAIRSDALVQDESDDETADGELSTLRSFATIASILVYKLCPPGHPNNPDYCTEGFPNAKDVIKPYKWWITTMLNRHGCNCFPTTNDQGKRIPVVNGIPKDDLDAACGDLAKTIFCIEDMVESGQYFKDYDCTYNENYFFYYNADTYEVACGKDADPGYYNSTTDGQLRCQRSVCEADLDFADKVVDYLGGAGHEGGLDAKAHRWNNANPWNRNRNDFTCDKRPGQEREVKCCGRRNPWLRQPYNNLTHRCCNKKRDLVKRNTPEVQSVCLSI